MQEVIVTAARRAQDVTQIPYNITAVGRQQIQRTGVVNIEDLSQQVPNLVVTSSGAQNLGAQRQIMRGLNASASDRDGVTIEQNPVSTYLGNAPYGNFFQVEDIDRVEVLRGPQGTLYGTGALAGAIRLIPTEPALGRFTGHISGSTAYVGHASGDEDYSFKAVVNVPLGDTLALRVAGGYQHNAGYLDQFGIWERSGNSPIAPPVLKDPSSPLTSEPVLYNVKGVNWSNSTDLRVALRWKPNDKFDATLATNISRINGYGPNYDTPGDPGGPDPLQPSVVYPATGEYQLNSRVLAPFSRKSTMTTLDASYDFGFATLSSTSSYFTTVGETYSDATQFILAAPPIYLPYYTGTPANPRFNVVQLYNDTNRVFTQEVRLVSKGEGPLDYVVGAFYQNERNVALWNGFVPGQGVYDSLPGVAIPGFPPGAQDRAWLSGGVNDFTDEALFGELTWHAINHLDLTFAMRTFRQTLNRTVENQNPFYGVDSVYQNSDRYSSNKFRFNATYEYTPGHRAYFTFSQGFRRGGANAFPLTGFTREPASLLVYKPDSVDNYEVGLKGRLKADWLPGDGWLYTVDVFDDKWHDPQIGGFTAVNYWPVVFNGKEAESKGFEGELSGALSRDFSFQLGYSYTDSKLTQDFCIPAGDATGNPSPIGDIPCAIQGIKGTVLPSAPRHSATFTLNYDHELDANNSLHATLNANYKSSTRQNLPTVGALYPIDPSYALINVYAGWKHGPVTTSIYVRNLFDNRVVYSVNPRVTAFPSYSLQQVIGHPRTVGIKVGYDW